MAQTTSAMHQLILHNWQTYTGRCVAAKRLLRAVLASAEKDRQGFLQGLLTSWHTASQDNNPFTVYVVTVRKDNSQWRVFRRYKEWEELLPGCVRACLPDGWL